MVKFAKPYRIGKYTRKQTKRTVDVGLSKLVKRRVGTHGTTRRRSSRT